MRSFAGRVRTKANIHDAWRKIQENGRNSASQETRREIAEFSDQAAQRLDRLTRKLRAGTFEFPKSKGIAAKKKSGGKRPIVLAPIEARIVQRAILNVIQDIPAIRAKIGVGHNFGGIVGAGVPEAIDQAVMAARASGYFIRTDIKSFFINVPRDRALLKITEITKEEEFALLLKGATDTELNNLASLGEDSQLFPLEGTGVAQGSCLSPLLCNLLLEDFDAAMNDRGIRCIRYIDDFILFARDRRHAFAALKSARGFLSKLGLDAYNPLENSEKAEHGPTSGTIAFLGCEIQKDAVRPSRAARNALLNRVKSVFDDSLGALATPKLAVERHQTFAEALVDASHVIRGWGNSYAFCTDQRVNDFLDEEIKKRLVDFREGFRKRIDRMKRDDRQRALGLFLLADCRYVSLKESFSKL